VVAALVQADEEIVVILKVVAAVVVDSKREHLHYCPQLQLTQLL
jgi:hypothetical protein